MEVLCNKLLAYQADKAVVPMFGFLSIQMYEPSCRLCFACLDVDIGLRGQRYWYYSEKENPKKYTSIMKPIPFYNIKPAIWVKNIMFICMYGYVCILMNLARTYTVLLAQWKSAR